MVLLATILFNTNLDQLGTFFVLLQQLHFALAQVAAGVIQYDDNGFKTLLWSMLILFNSTLDDLESGDEPTNSLIGKRFDLRINQETYTVIAPNPFVAHLIHQATED